MRAIMVMLVMLASVTAGAQETKSWALWSANKKTLYFVRDNVDHQAGEKHNNVSIANVWKIADYNDKKQVATEKTAQWVKTAKGTCTHVVFEFSFSKARPISCKGWFNGFAQLTSISNIIHLKTNEVTDMSYMFKGCKSLKSLNLAKFNTSNVTDMSHMFDGCSGLATLNTGTLDAQNVTDMSFMFRGCASLKTLDLTDFVSSHVRNMRAMFKGCDSLTSLNLCGFNIQSVGMKNMTNMFFGCGKLVSIFIDDHIWKKVKSGQKNMFKNCQALVGADGTAVAKMNKNTIKKMNQDGKKWAHAGENGLLRLDQNFSLNGPDEIVSFWMKNKQVTSAREGDQVEVEVDVPEGNKLLNLTATCGNTPVTLTYDDDEGVYTFTMPDGPVTVTPVFEKFYTLAGNVSFDINGTAVEKAMPGELVSFAATIPEGKMVNQLTVMQGEAPVEFDDYGDGTGEFMMPNSNVTVTVTIKDAPTEYTVTGDEHMTFYVNGWEVEEGEKVSVGEIVVVEVEDPDGQRLDVLTATRGTTPITTTLDEDGNHYFTMPWGEVEVTATYMDPYALSGGQYVDFYDGGTHQIVEAFRGEKVWVDVDPDAIDGGMYLIEGNYKSDSEDVHFQKEEDGVNYYFIMPDHDVTVDAVLTKQETLVLNLLTDEATETIEGREMASLMMQWEGYLTDVKIVEKTSNDPYDYLYRHYDFNGDGKNDAVMIEKSKSSDVEPTYTMKREDGVTSLGANYCMTLRSPGFPSKYKDVLFNFGKSETVTCIFLYDGLNNNHTLMAYDGEKVNASFPDRILYKDGDWNTLCLPFDVTVAGSPLDGDGVEVKTLKEASLNDEGTLTLTFTDKETELKAGVPYLIKWKQPEPYVAFSYEHPELASDLYAPTFKNVKLNATLNPETIDELISFEGTYTLWERIDDSPSMLLLGAKNELYYPKKEIVKTEIKIGEEIIEEISENYSYLYPFRAYFQLLGGIEAIDPSLGGSIKNMVVDFGDEETGIEELKDSEIEKLKSGTWYTLQGVQLDGKPSVKGVYIYNGRKVVIK